MTQLFGAVPRHWLQYLAAASDAVILKMAADQVQLWVRCDGISAEFASGKVSQLSSMLREKQEMPRLALLELGPEYGLCKRLTLPHATRRDLDATLGFEIARETPFEQSEVYWTYRVATPDPENLTFDVDLVVIPRRIVDPLLKIASGAGLNISALQVDLGGSSPALIWIDVSPGVSLISPQPGLRPFALAAAALAVATVVMPFALQQLHIYLADRTIEQLEPQARQAAALKLAAGRRLAAIQFFGRSHGANGSALSTLAAVTSALPNDTYLNALSIHDGKLTLLGSSEAAGHLIGALSSSPAFRNPSFDSAVVEGEDDQEKFTISANLTQAGVP